MRYLDTALTWLIAEGGAQEERKRQTKCRPPTRAPSPLKIDRANQQQRQHDNTTTPTGLHQRRGAAVDPGAVNQPLGAARRAPVSRQHERPTMARRPVLPPARPAAWIGSFCLARRTTLHKHTLTLTTQIHVQNLNFQHVRIQIQIDQIRIRQLSRVREAARAVCAGGVARRQIGAALHRFRRRRRR